ARRSFLRPAHHLFDRLPRPFEHRLHRPGIEVAHPAGEPAATGLVRRRVPEPHSLHPTPDAHMSPCQGLGHNARPSWGARTVCAARTATVVGPVPPGTGVMAAAISRTASDWTSPTSDPSGLGFVPKSITMAPGRTCSAPISPARPAATHRTSASRVSGA